mmetsp:Transcript_11379/g.31745  ORF Transcript_11379/g.31745 Transcript_11379/m.31745 type:complete len:124 (-) Transcript_11379:810-1181(-)
MRPRGEWWWPTHVRHIAPVHCPGVSSSAARSVSGGCLMVSPQMLSARLEKRAREGCPDAHIQGLLACCAAGRLGAPQMSCRSDGHPYQPKSLISEGRWLAGSCASGSSGVDLVSGVGLEGSSS